MVVLTSGHLVDEPGRSPPRFPTALEPVVEARIQQLFEDWSVGVGDLVLSGGARGADIMFAECGLRRSAQVRLLLALPPEKFVGRSVAHPDHRWEARFFRLLEQCPVDVLPQRLRTPAVSPFELANAWMIEEARRLRPSERLVAALVWDERPSSGRGGTGGMATLLRQQGIQMAVINPLALRNSRSHQDGTAE